jgi:hypothetical protein
MIHRDMALFHIHQLLEFTLAKKTLDARRSFVLLRFPCFAYDSTLFLLYFHLFRYIFSMTAYFFTFLWNLIWQSRTYSGK